MKLELDDLDVPRTVEDSIRKEALGENADSTKGDPGHHCHRKNDSRQQHYTHDQGPGVVPRSQPGALVPRNLGVLVD